MGFRQAVLILGLAAITFAQDVATKADEFVSAFAKQGNFSGAVLIAKDGKVVFDKAYGMANYEWSIPNATTTRFRLGSITKQFTAAAILKLEEQGKLKTTDKICDYLPACAEPWKTVTIHQLLTHTSGIPSFTGVPEYNKFKALPSRYDEQIKAVISLPMDFDPGTKFKYNNTGYLMLGQIIEKASGKSYEAYLTEQLFVPAGMTNTRADSNAALIPQRASGYNSGNGKPRNADFIDMRIPGGAGTLLSTTADLYAWDRALASGKLFSEASTKKMFTPEKNNYAYGWIVTPQGPNTSQAHSGGIDGFSTFLDRVPATGALIVILGNFEDAPTGAIRRGLVEIADGRTAEAPRQRTEIQLDTVTLDEYVGVYTFAPTFAMTITREGNQLITQATNQGKLPVFAEAKDVFFPKVIPATITFTRENGKVTGLVLKQGGREMKAPRQP